MALHDYFDPQNNKECICSTCNGTGKLECSVCKGHGKYDDGEVCEECDGVGELKCSDCDGEGKVELSLWQMKWEAMGWQ